MLSCIERLAVFIATSRLELRITVAPVLEMLASYLAIPQSPPLRADEMIQ